MYCKVFARVIDSSGKYPMPGSRGFASMDLSTQRHQFFGFKFEIRADKINPTLLLLVSFETWDKANNRACFAGHSYFPLFMDKKSELPITDANSNVSSRTVNPFRTSLSTKDNIRCLSSARCRTSQLSQ